jgi:hypothetical protein
MLPVAMKLIGRVRYFLPILMKFGVSRQIFIKVPKIKFHGNPSSENCADTCGKPTDVIKVIDAFKVLRELLQSHSLALVPLASRAMDFYFLQEG